ncbi:MAG: hypothetical protein LQ345_004724 [Seirophora villosa]|nr:MAG: hypothetical protein LQ345_004724 [Seirophora villosa]
MGCANPDPESGANPATIRHGPRQVVSSSASMAPVSIHFVLNDSAFADEHCPDEDGDQMRDTDMVVTPCPDNSYCCGEQNTTCCDQGDGVWIRDGSPTRINPDATQAGPEPDPATATTTAPVSDEAITTTTPAAPEVTQSPPQSTGLKGGAIAGIVIGSILGVAMLGLAFWYFGRRKSRHAKNDTQQHSDDKIPLDEGASATGRVGDTEKDFHIGDTPALELPARGPRIPELHANDRGELAGSTPPLREIA